jgi:hypothetical protein
MSIFAYRFITIEKTAKAPNYGRIASIHPASFLIQFAVRGKTDSKAVNGRTNRAGTMHFRPQSKSGIMAQGAAKKKRARLTALSALWNSESRFVT